MDIELAEQHLFLLQQRITPDEAQQRAMDRRMNAISSGITSLLQRPKPEDVVLVGTQLRLDPFWHVSGSAHYEYARMREYAVPVPAAEVRTVTVSGTDATVVGAGTARHFAIAVNEQCIEDLRNELFISAVTGEAIPDGATIVTGPRDEVLDPALLGAGDATVVPPEHRSSFVVRTLLSGMIKPLQADSVSQEHLALDHTDLYYRPIRAYEFHWVSKDRRGVVEVDAITGQVNMGKSLVAGLSKMLTRDALFDVGADTAGLLIPGGSIAVKVAKMALDHSTRPAE